MQNKPIQKIIFGSPGTGKSYRIDNKIIPTELKISEKSNIIKTVFHPEYTYGDFIGKLVPYTKAGKVEYNFYEGHFLIALAQAYKNILKAYKEDEEDTELDDFWKGPLEVDNAALVIDEINRGNSASIFGTIFQLLDRDKEGWSSYYINVTQLELYTILQLIGVEFKALADNQYEYKFPGESNYVKNLKTLQKHVDVLKLDLEYNRIFIPPNLSILATMNTSDNSIYFMDNAFKRRWDWEFINVDDDNQNEVAEKMLIKIQGEDYKWVDFVDNLNNFIRSKYREIRKIEDKQIGYFFINEDVITEEHIKNKLLFFVWDSVFTNNKKPLVKLLELSDDNLVTFGQFALQAKNFVDKIMEVE